MSLFHVPGWSMPSEMGPIQVEVKRRRKSESLGAVSTNGVTQTPKKKRRLEDDKRVPQTVPKNIHSGRKIKSGYKESRSHDKELKARMKARTKVSLHINTSRDSSRLLCAHRDDDRVKKLASKGTPLVLDGAKSDELPSEMDISQKRRGRDRSTLLSSSSLSRQKGTFSEPFLTSMQKNMRDSLDGARFRWINEALYKSNSQEALNLMKVDKGLFEEYHTGFRRQVKLWPKNPMAHYISSLASSPKGTVIADLGCGDAALAKQLLPLGITVLSYDLLSCNTFVVEADICEHIPLPGGNNASEEEGQSQVVDIVICSLSLMSTNWLGCIREAWRIIKLGGRLEIAEVTSRFSNIDEFVDLICCMGFELEARDQSNTHFMLFTFIKSRKSRLAGERWDEILRRGSVLRACEYRKR